MKDKARARNDIACGMGDAGCQGTASFAIWWELQPSEPKRRFACSRCIAAAVANAIRDSRTGEARVYLIGWVP